MSEMMKINHKRTQAVSPTGSSMHFWGICCESGKQYAQVVGQRFRITMAVLDPNSFMKEHNDKIVSLLVNRDDIEYLLCVLKHGEIHQMSLNLIFDKGEKVKFYINGHGKVYLSGYQLTDSERDVLNDENGYLCPLVEVRAKNKKRDSPMVSPKDQKTTKSRKMKSDKSESPGQSFWNTFLNKDDDDDDDDDDEDDDESFSLGEEDTDSEEESSSDIDDTDDDDDDEDEEESEEEVVVNSIGSPKRKKTDKVQKRSRNDTLNSTSNSTPKSVTDNVVCIDDDSESDDMASFHESMSAGHTPMPKKRKVSNETPVPEKSKEVSNVTPMPKKSKEVSNETPILKKSKDSNETPMPKRSKEVSNETPMPKKSKEVSSETKKSKKKKKNDMFNVSDPSIKNENEKSTNESTPKSQVKSHPVVIKNDVEIQDLVIGRGPEAIRGKMAHVFYVGRLSNKVIFDARLPGKKPFSFKIGAHDVIKGWDVGLEGMKVGGKRRLKIPPHMAYGKAGKIVNECCIPPNSTLSFMVELQAVS